MKMKWILLLALIYGTSSLVTATFETKEACENGLNEFKKNFTPGRIQGICVPNQ